MSFFKDLLKPSSPKPSPSLLIPVPAQLPKVAAPTAEEICEKCDPSPAAQALLTPQQTPSQYLGALQETQMGDEMVKAMAHGLPDREGVWWAVRSAEQISGDLPADDLMALQAALAWVKNPNAANQSAATIAADKTNFQGPGAWAAQAASWAQSTTQAKSDGASSPRLAPNAVVTAVLLSSAIAANPQLASPKFRVPALTMPKADGMNLQAPSLSLPQLAAAGAGLAGLAVPGVSAPSLQTPSVAKPNLKAPSLSGAGPSAPKLGGLNLPAPNLQTPSLTAPNVSAPQLSTPSSGLSAPSLAKPSVTAPAMPASTLAAPNLQAPKFPAAPSAAAGMAVPNISAPAFQIPKLDTPQVAVPPKVKAKVFGAQYPFITLGIDIAAGKSNWA